MKKTKIIIVVVIIAIIGLITGRLVSNKKEINSKKEVKTVAQEIVVTVASAEVATTDGNLKLAGTAEACKTVVVASEISGKIVRMNFKLGDYVAKGTILAQVDDTYKRLALETAQVNYEKAKDDYTRHEALRKGDAVTETQFRDKKVDYDNASIKLEDAKKQFSDTRITAPFGGYITSQNVELGTHVNIGTSVAGMVDISQLKITMSVSESNVYALKQGQTVNVTASVYPQAGYAGKISNISPKGDASHTYPVEILISNSTQFPLKAGTYVNAEINMGKSAEVLMIPRDAIVSSVKDPSVYIVEGNIAKLTKITVGQDYGKNIEVLEGLQANDQVVVSGQINLMDGAKVSTIK